VTSSDPQNECYSERWGVVGKPRAFSRRREALRMWRRCKVWQERLCENKRYPTSNERRVSS